MSLPGIIHVCNLSRNIYFLEKEVKNGVFDYRSRKPDLLTPSPEDLKSRMSEVLKTQQSM
jgi:hypothetical protein